MWMSMISKILSVWITSCFDFIYIILLYDQGFFLLRVYYIWKEFGSV